MNRRVIAVIACAWVLSLVSAALWAQSATNPVSRLGTDPTAVTAIPSVLSGGDIGFRVTGPVDRAGKVPGVLVVKIGGRWVEAASVSK